MFEQDLPTWQNTSAILKRNILFKKTMICSHVFSFGEPGSDLLDPKFSFERDLKRETLLELIQCCDNPRYITFWNV